MKLVRMVREEPTKGGATSLNVPEVDVDKLKYQGWVVADENKAVPEPEKPKQEPAVKAEPKATAAKPSEKPKAKVLRDE